MEQEDAALIHAARCGDRAAYAELFARHCGPARRYAYSLIGDDIRADDLVSDAFIKVMARLDDGAGPTCNFRSYLFSTIRNSMVDHARREQRELLQGDLCKEAEALLGSDTSESYAETTVVMRALMRLPVRWREALWCSRVLEESHEDIAARLGIRTNAVGVLCYRAREGLRQAYLAEHVMHAPGSDCRCFSEAMPAYVRGQLSPRKTKLLEAHLATCEHCTAAVTELAQVNMHLGALVSPAILLAASAHAGLIGWICAHSEAVKVVAAGAVVSFAAASALVSLSGAPEPPALTGPETSRTVATASAPQPAPRPTSRRSTTPTPAPSRRPTPTHVPHTAGADPRTTPTAAGEPHDRVRMSEPRTAARRANGAAIAYVSVSGSTDDGPLHLVVDLANVTASRVTLGAGDWSCGEAAAEDTSIRLTCVSRGDVRDGARFGLSAHVADADASVAGSVRMSDGGTSRIRGFTIRH